MDEQILFIVGVLVGIFILITLNTFIMDSLNNLHDEGIQEGFGDLEIPGSTDEKGVVRWLDSKELYDTFYASIYDQLTQGVTRTKGEVGLMLHEWTKTGDDVKTFNVLDAGCGTGIAVASFAKMGVKGVTGMDISTAMLTQARGNLERTVLSNHEKKAIQWKEGDVMNSSVFPGSHFTHAFMTYFTIYYLSDKETVFRNLFHWIKPGGRLVIHVVNKHKFDPMLESSAPWIGFSLQKYSTERIKKSEVVFNKFKYVGEFDLEDPQAEFRETFRFKDGKVRRQRHVFRMEDMNFIVERAVAAGWEYQGHVDLTPIGLEYFFHLHFRHP